MRPGGSAVEQQPRKLRVAGSNPARGSSFCIEIDESWALIDENFFSGLRLNYALIGGVVLPFLPLLLEWAFLLILLIIGVLIILFVAKVLFFFLPAAIVALVVWLITHDKTLTGIAFLLVAAISIAKRK